MAAEAMFAMQRPNAVISWVRSYKSRLQDRPKPGNAISPEEWRQALGDVSRVGSRWHIENEIEQILIWHAWR